MAPTFFWPTAVRGLPGAGAWRVCGSSHILHLHLPATPDPRDVGRPQQRPVQDGSMPWEMYTAGRYPGYYLRYLQERNIMPGDQVRGRGAACRRRIDLSGGKPLPDPVRLPTFRPIRPTRRGNGSFGATRWISTSSDISGTSRNPFLGSQRVRRADRSHGTASGAPTEYYRKYRLPMIITENGLGAADVLSADGQVHDPGRIAYLSHINCQRGRHRGRGGALRILSLVRHGPFGFPPGLPKALRPDLCEPRRPGAAGPAQDSQGQLSLLVSKCNPQQRAVNDGRNHALSEHTKRSDSAFLPILQKWSSGPEPDAPFRHRMNYRISRRGES